MGKYGESFAERYERVLKGEQNKEGYGAGSRRRRQLELAKQNLKIRREQEAAARIAEQARQKLEQERQAEAQRLAEKKRQEQLSKPKTTPTVEGKAGVSSFSPASSNLIGRTQQQSTLRSLAARSLLPSVAASEGKPMPEKQGALSRADQRVGGFFQSFLTKARARKQEIRDAGLPVPTTYRERIEAGQKSLVQKYAPDSGAAVISKELQGQAAGVEGRYEKALTEKPVTTSAVLGGLAAAGTGVGAGAAFLSSKSVAAATAVKGVGYGLAGAYGVTAVDRYRKLETPQERGAFALQEGAMLTSLGGGGKSWREISNKLWWGYASTFRF
jgi:hypothetical protein